MTAAERMEDLGLTSDQLEAMEHEEEEELQRTFLQSVGGVW